MVTVAATLALVANLAVLGLASVSIVLKTHHEQK